MNVTASSSSYGQEAMIASLGKKQQEAEGQAALQLLQSATQSVQAVSRPTPEGSLGMNVDVFA
ncbi:hypothetical protein ACFOSS_15030 [Pseudaeromonas sharmana]|uniref:Motility protein n=1 Tax=Pseudaeromonas sharmana TaxID=328412 RepID=A0ABV8CRB8_9GAMM